MVNFIDKETTERIILEPEDQTEEEFKVLKKLFGVKNAKVDSIIIPRGMKYHIVIQDKEMEVQLSRQSAGLKRPASEVQFLSLPPMWVTVIPRVSSVRLRRLKGSTPSERFKTLIFV